MESSDKFGEYAELRTEYITALEEADLLDDRGLLRGDVVAGLSGTRIPSGGRLPEYCRERPIDPICKYIDVGEKVEEFVEIRGEYIDSLEERDLLDVQSAFTDAVVAGGYLGGRSAGTGGTAIPAPGVDPDDIPWPLRPYVQPGGTLFDQLPPQVGALF